MSSMEPELTRDSVLKQVGPCFLEMDARAFVKLEPEAAIFAIMTLAKRVAELTRMAGKAGPLAPPGQMATFLKPKTKDRRKKPGLDTPVPVGKHPSQTKPCRTAWNAVLIVPAACRNAIQVVPGSSRTSRRIPSLRSPSMCSPGTGVRTAEKGGGRSAG